MSEQIKRYLGDSVYSVYDGWGITLTTENGYGPSNKIYLEPEVLDALMKHWQHSQNPAPLTEDGCKPQHTDCE